LLGQLTSAALDSAEHSRDAELREQRWRAVIEATPAAIVELSHDGRIVLWNRSAAALFGWPAHDTATAIPAPEGDGHASVGEDRATAGWPVFAPAAQAALSARWAPALARGEVVETELVAVEVAGGDTRDLMVQIAPLLSEEPGQGALLLASDVTEQRRLNESMARAQQMDALGQLAGRVAHDFNNLLTIIGGYADLMRDRLSEGATTEELDGIRSAVDRATVLTQQLLAIGRRHSSHPVPLDPEDALRRLGEVLERILGVDIDLRCRLQSGAGRILVDAGRFEQAILSLAFNARDAMAQGGSLEIACERMPPEPGLVTPGPIASEYVHISVTDTGSGMDETTRLRCFEPFYTTKDRAKGTGLGLAAVNGVVVESNGAIQVSSQLGEGTTFDLYFPLVESEVAPVVAPPSPSPRRHRGSEVVLVVEDENVVRTIIRRVLTRAGYLVLDAADGIEAQRIASTWEGPIDLLLTDVVLPGLRGPEVAAAVRALRPRVPVLFISAYSDGAVFTGPLADEVATMLPKPFKPTELVAYIRATLDRDRNLAIRSGSPPP